MPKLTGFIILFLIQLVSNLWISLSKYLVEFQLTRNTAKIEWHARLEDD